MDPEGDRLEVTALGAVDTGAPLGPQRPGARAERRQLQRLPEAREALHDDGHAAHHPDAVVGDAGVDDVGPGGVLQPARDGVQARAAVGRDVAEAGRDGMRVDAPGGRGRDHDGVGGGHDASVCRSVAWRA